MVIFNRMCIIYLNVFEYILLHLRWHYSPVRTFASFMDFSQSVQFFDLYFQFSILYLLMPLCLNVVCFDILK